MDMTAPYPPGFGATAVSVFVNSGTQYVIDAQMVQRNFESQHMFNAATQTAIKEIHEKLDVLEWVKEHYPEVLVQYAANIAWNKALNKGPVCGTTTK